MARQMRGKAFGGDHEAPPTFGPHNHRSGMRDSPAWRAGHGTAAHVRTVDRTRSLVPVALYHKRCHTPHRHFQDLEPQKMSPRLLTKRPARICGSAFTPGARQRRRRQRRLLCHQTYRRTECQRTPGGRQDRSAAPARPAAPAPHSYPAVRPASAGIPYAGMFGGTRAAAAGAAAAVRLG